MKTKKSLFGIQNTKLSQLLAWLKINRQKRRNQRSLKIYNNCDFLPAWRFFKILETDDKRYLLKCDKLPEYFEHLLEPVWDDIINQFDKLNGEFVLTNAIRDEVEDIIMINSYIILKAAFELMQLGEKKALPILQNDCGVNVTDITPDSIKKVRTQVLRAQTKLQIHQLKKAARKENDEKKEGNTYIRSVIQMSSILGRQLNKDKITVTEWIYLDKECKEIIKIKKEHGRRSKVK